MQVQSPVQSPDKIYAIIRLTTSLSELYGLVGLGLSKKVKLWDVYFLVELQTRNTSPAKFSSDKAIPRLQRIRHPKPSEGPLDP